MIRALCIVMILLPVATFAEPKEVARTYILNQEAILREDGTWQFADEDVVMSAPAPDACLSSDDARVSFCPDASHWTDRQIMSSDGLEDHLLISPDKRFTLSASLDKNYGHDGDIDYFASTGDSSGFLTRLLFRAARLDVPEEQLFIRKDIVVIVTDMIEAESYYRHSVEVILPTQSFYFEIISDPTGMAKPGFASFEELRREAAVQRERLAQAILIEDTPLTAFAEKASE